MNKKRLMEKIQKYIKTNDMDNVISLIKDINEETWFNDVSKLMSRMSLIECYATINNRKVEISDFNESIETLKSKIFDCLAEVSRTEYLMPLSLVENILDKDELISQGYTHHINVSKNRDNFMDFLDSTNINYIVDMSGNFSLKLSENNTSEVETYLNMLLSEATDENNINAPKWPTDTRGQYKAVTDLTTPDYGTSDDKVTTKNGGECNTLLDDDLFLTDFLGNIPDKYIQKSPDYINTSPKAKKQSEDAPDENSNEKEEDTNNDENDTKKSLGENSKKPIVTSRNPIAKDLASGKYSTRMTKTKKEKEEKLDNSSRKAKHKKIDESREHMKKKLSEKVLGLSAVEPINRMKQLAGIKSNKIREFEEPIDTEFEPSYDDGVDTDSFDGSFDDPLPSEFDGEFDDLGYDGGVQGDIGSDPISSIDADANSYDMDAYASITTDIDNIRTNLSSIKLSEYTELVKQVQMLYDEVLNLGKSTYMGS